ncbi:hypothetical protein [Sorangium sp. So ce1024]|uniref:hypothetical protein n=1 Tax=Sorangium sp. So ce1024 TaxID=3133327 RepID=UPI003F0BF7D0
MTTAVGLTAQTTAASVRAGISYFRETAILDRRSNPVVMATVPDVDLPPRARALDAITTLTTRQTRMLRLAGVALRESLGGIDRIDRIPLLLAAPEPHPGRAAVVEPRFLEQLAVQAEVRFDIQRSRVFPRGRAAVFPALCEALYRLASRTDEHVLVGGVDSHVDLQLLGTLDREERIRADGVPDGFIPGEGAAFLLLTSPGIGTRTGLAPLARLEGAAFADEPGHRYSEEIYRGDGLDLAFRRLFAAMPVTVQTVYAGFNGENFNAKEWGVSYMRHRERFAEDFAIEHPADCLGDTGAALGPMLMALASIGMKKGYRRSPCLAWCSSDQAERGAAIVSRG